jgi:hypothetical protein
MIFMKESKFLSLDTIQQVKKGVRPQRKIVKI